MLERFTIEGVGLVKTLWKGKKMRRGVPGFIVFCFLYKKLVPVIMIADEKKYWKSVKVIRTWVTSIAG